MGANDVCKACGQPLNFFDYILIVIKDMNGPDVVRQISHRYCRVCASNLFGD